jgi:hypothetical protein
MSFPAFRKWAAQNPEQTNEYLLHHRRSGRGRDRHRLFWSASLMNRSTQYLAKAVEYGDLANATASLTKRHEFQELEGKFSVLAVLADNEQLLEEEGAACSTYVVNTTPTTLAAEDQVLRCLGAALIMQWNTLPAKLQRELFDNAGDMGALLDSSTLRGQIARFLHAHKNDVSHGGDKD